MKRKTKHLSTILSTLSLTTLAAFWLFNDHPFSVTATPASKFQFSEEDFEDLVFGPQLPADHIWEMTETLPPAQEEILDIQLEAALLNHTEIEEETFIWPEFMPPVFYEEILEVTDPYDPLVLVNKNFKLDPAFSPSDMRIIQVRDFENRLISNLWMRDEAATAAESLFHAALEEGITLWARSGYRSFRSQGNAHQNLIARMGRSEAERLSARPGHSEHQTGLALDVTSAAVNGRLVASFSQTAEGTWLRENAHYFGFIIRYPEGREHLTGYAYEPWHIRYVGVDHASVIYENGLILEEYLLGMNFYPFQAPAPEALEIQTRY